MNGLDRGRLDAWLTREPPEPPVDPHAPFVASAGEPGQWWVHADPEEAAEAVFTDSEQGGDARAAAEAFAAARNRQEGAPANSDGPDGLCTACGDFHVIPHSAREMVAEAFENGSLRIETGFAETEADARSALHWPEE